MEIDKKGYTLSDLESILDRYVTLMQSKYGSDFYIKPEGVIDNILTSAGAMEMFLQNRIAYLCKQFDPNTADRKYQDALYERVGLKRIAATATSFTKAITGTPNFTGEAGSITIQNSLTGYEFVNSQPYTIDETGSANLTFKANVDGAIIVNPTDKFEIVEAPAGVSGIAEGEAYGITTGRDEESDAEFRKRFKSIKTTNAKATRNANLINLSKYVDNNKFLKIIDGKTDSSFAPGEIQIIAKHNTTDEIFARAIFETVVDGLEYIGNTTVIVKDDSDEDVEIKFEKAAEPEIYISANLKLKNGFYPNNVFNNVRQSILNYIQNRVFGLQSSIYATEFIVPILETSGVEAVLDISVKKDRDFVESISLKRNEVPAFSEDRIILIAE